mgnify:CR=1 FL=1
MTPLVEPFFDSNTGTFSYVVYNRPGCACAVIDLGLARLGLRHGGLPDGLDDARELESPQKGEPIRSSWYETAETRLVRNFQKEGLLR